MNTTVWMTVLVIPEPLKSFIITISGINTIFTISLLVTFTVGDYLIARRRHERIYWIADAQRFQVIDQMFIDVDGPFIIEPETPEENQVKKWIDEAKTK
jgi:hypothetical protein